MGLGEDLLMAQPVEGGRRRRGGADLLVEEPQVEGGRRRRRGKGILSGLLGSIGLGMPEGPQQPLEGGRRRRGKGDPVVAEGKKKKAPSKWIMHCKEYAKKHNLKYNEALKDPKCRMSYRK